jgi:predicted acyltransferase
MSEQSGHAVHTMIVLCGVVLTLIFFDLSKPRTIYRRYVEAGIFTLAIFLIGYFLRPYYTISKIKATPSWGLYSAVICCLIFMVVYWIIDIRKFDRWTSFFQPAASNPLLTYIIPSIVYAFMKLAGLSFPHLFYDGITGVIWAATYSVLVMGLVKILNNINIKLQL